MSAQIDDLIEEVREMKEAFIELRAVLGERCPDHQRRIQRLENGTSRAIRTWGAIMALVATTIGVIITIATIWKGS